MCAMISRAVNDGLQEIVDALSERLDRPVLVDDVELRPLAYSSQTGELDFVRTASILSRHAPDAARDVLFAYGIRAASLPVRIPAHPEIPMSARICLPIVSAGQAVGFLWLLEEPPVREDELALAVAAAADAAGALLPDDDALRRRERELLERLLGDDPELAREAAAALEDDSYIPLRPLVVCVDIVDFHHDSATSRAVRARRDSAVDRVLVGDDDRTVAVGQPRSMSACSPYLGESEGATQPVDGRCNIGVDQFRDDTGRTSRAADQHPASL